LQACDVPRKAEEEVEQPEEYAMDMGRKFGWTEGIFSSTQFLWRICTPGARREMSRKPLLEKKTRFSIAGL